MNKLDCMKLRMKSDSRAAWYYPLQKGFFLSGQSGMSVREFLHEVLRFDDVFIEKSVRTIFLNNSPVDNIDEAYIKEGDRMALGSAMPGLVGIVMGRDNPFKSFRDDISVHDEGKSENRTPITVSMKLFSTLAVETGVAVLGRGVILKAGDLADFLEDKVDAIIEADGSDGLSFIAMLREKGGKVTVAVDFE